MSLLALFFRPPGGTFREAQMIAAVISERGNKVKIWIATL